MTCTPCPLTTELESLRARVVLLEHHLRDVRAENFELYRLKGSYEEARDFLYREGYESCQDERHIQDPEYYGCHGWHPR